MINDSVYQDHLSMLSASVEIFPAKMFKHARYTACSSVLAWSDFAKMSRSCLSVQVFCKFVEEMIGNDNDR